jgi:endoglucanase
MFSRRRGRLVTVAAAGQTLAFIVLAALVQGSSAGTAAAAMRAERAQAAPAVTGSLPASTKFYINPNSNVEQWVAANPGNPDEPLIAADIASQPQATWFTTYDPTTIESGVSSLVTAAAAVSEVPVLVAYDIPNRDCGGASAGGAPTIADYETWISNFAAGLGSAPVIVLVEPDSLALQTCLSSSDASARDAAIAFAGHVIRTDDPNARVYFDGGHSDWNPASQQAAALEAADVTTDANGVFTNVSNFEWTNDELYYGQQILTDIGDSSLHLVIDTSRNGAGPDNTWCDPSDVALGLDPTADTGYSYVDAFLWVKPPGESDGCAAAAGTFVPSVADTLATNPNYAALTPSCSATYAIQSAWTGGFTATVTLTNTGGHPFGGWTVSFTYPGDEQVTNLWDAYYTQSGETVAAHDPFDTGETVGPGASVSYGMQGTYTNSNAVPTSFTLTANNGQSVTCATG